MLVSKDQKNNILKIYKTFIENIINILIVIMVWDSTDCTV